MRRRIIAPFIVIISLLTGCRHNIELRSDIRKFITSFSVNEARKIYLEAGYTRQDLSIEEAGEVKVIQTMDFNIKDLEAISFDMLYQKYLNNELQSETHRFVSIEDGVYTLHKVVNGQETVSTITAQNLIQNNITNFFYVNEIEEIHSLGMYVGDTLKEILLEIQKYVTVDFELETLTYDIPWGAKKGAKGYEFEEVLVVDKLGMTKSCFIHQTNGIVEMTTNISVYNNL